MDLGVPEIALIVAAVLLLFGYKKLPDASRSIGRSLRIFKGEMKGLEDDDVRPDEPPATRARAQLIEEARPAETYAAEMRARAQNGLAPDLARGPISARDGGAGVYAGD